LKCKGTQEGLEFPVSPASSSTSSLGKKQEDKRFKGDKGKGDAPRCFKYGSTDHLIADCPEASADDQTKKGKNVKFAALVAKLPVDTLEDPFRLPCVRLNECMEVNYLLDAGSDLTVIPRIIILECLAAQSLVNEVPVDVFEIGLSRSDVSVVCSVRVKMDVNLVTRAGSVLIWDLETYVVDAPMDVLFAYRAP
jgi:hypothetical protein